MKILVLILASIVMDLPLSMRQQNWEIKSGPKAVRGSCVTASMVSLLRWQGHHKDAERIKAKYGGGRDYYEWKGILDAEGIKYSSTKGVNQVEFLERSIKTRRGCMVGVQPFKKFKEPSHMVCLVDLTATEAVLLDCNNPKDYVHVERKAFLAEWERAGSWALTPVYTPTSPRVK